jgi:hypothetical protein
VEEFEELDKVNFELSQVLKSSKVKQQALEDSIASLSMMIMA